MVVKAAACTTPQFGDAGELWVIAASGSAAERAHLEHLDVAFAGAREIGARQRVGAAATEYW
jgi:hypothetical protein